MLPSSSTELTEFRAAILRSERIRTLCMIVVIGLFALLGLFRIVAPVDGRLTVGICVLATSLVYLAFEFFMLRQVGRAIAASRQISPWLARSQLVLECLFPLGIIWVLAWLMPEYRYTLLVSPAYALLMLLIGVSVLRVDPTATLLTGLACLAGYMALVVWVLTSASTVEPNPHPTAMYFNLALVVALATGAAIFIARQVRTYVAAAVREMQTRREHDRLKRDLEIAGEIQQGLLPPAMPELEQYAFAAVCRPADQAGGDYFDWQEVSRRRVVFSVGDVTGHGVGPALVTAACRAYVRAILGARPSPVALLTKVNELLHKDIPEGRFVTLVLIDLDTENHQYRLISAGHGPTLVVRAMDGHISTYDSQGLPLGLFEDQDIEEPVVGRLEPGDVMVAVSDGFFEWARDDDEAFGLERLLAVVSANRHETAEGILAAMDRSVRDFVGSRPQQDDVTGLVIKRLAMQG
ncbi:MAG: PP2C family protein-serine/threonine phosphatase [Planctomycetota bacterium]